MLNPLRDKNEGTYRGERRGETCDHGVCRSSKVNERLLIKKTRFEGLPSNEVHTTGQVATSLHRRGDIIEFFVSLRRVDPGISSFLVFVSA